MNGREPFPALVMRSSTRDDLPAVAATYRKLSSQSLYQRFFTLLPDPTPLVARQLALVDHRDHEAFVVLDGDEVVAMAQWDRNSGRPEVAEIAITVADDWQHLGLGRALIRTLAGDAHRRGIQTLEASVLTDNRAAVGLASSQQPNHVGIDGSETHYTFPLAS